MSGRGDAERPPGRAVELAVIASALVALAIIGEALPHRPSLFPWPAGDLVRRLGTGRLDTVAAHLLWMVACGLALRLTAAVAVSACTTTIANRTGAAERSTGSGEAAPPPPGRRRTALGILAGGVGAAAVVPATAAATVAIEDTPDVAAPEEVHPPRMRLVEPDDATAATPDDAEDPPIMRLLAATPASDPSPSGWGAPDRMTATWTVGPGDSFWAIAERALGHDGSEPATADVHAYWQRLIAANRSVLADPDDPDLLFTGQQLILPPT